MRRLITVIAFAAVLVPAGPAHPAGYRSKALHGTVHYSVYLPKGYSTSGKRYPVVYFLHGLPAGGDAYSRIGWVAHAAHKAGLRAIVVGAQGARGDDPDPEGLGWGGGGERGEGGSGGVGGGVGKRDRTLPKRRR